METNEKLITLLRLMDKPEQLTEAQLEVLLADEEVRKAYELMADCKKVYQRENLRSGTPYCCYGKDIRGEDARSSGLIFRAWSNRGWAYRIAAIFLGAAFLGGLAFAAWHAFSPSKGQHPTAIAVQDADTIPTLNSLPINPVRFDDVHLDSILAVVSTHYGAAVCFRDEEPRVMKFITTWNPADSLAAFIEHLNHFDYVHLTLREDTIFVESINDEEEGE